MKLSKTLLQAIAVGITLGATSSCSLFEDSKDVHLKSCDESCEIDHANEEVDTYNPYDCLACGMG